MITDDNVNDMVENDINTISHDNTINYQKHPEISNVVGFIVNIHDAVNYDIDLFLTEEQRLRYEDVIKDPYDYVDIHRRDIEDRVPTIDEAHKHQLSSTAYRCRLKGVGINSKNLNHRSYDRNIYGKNIMHASIHVCRIVDRCGGWVICNVTDIDVYRRLLVDIFVPVHQIIDVRLMLLAFAHDEYGGIFYPYGRKCQRNNKYDKYKRDRNLLIAKDRREGRGRSRRKNHNQPSESAEDPESNKETKTP